MISPKTVKNHRFGRSTLL